FGVYFALKLAGAGQGPASTGKAIGFAVLGFLLVFAGVFLAFGPKPAFPGKMVVGLLVMAVGGAVPFISWPVLAKALAAYGYAARIPVAVIMFFAIRGNWGTTTTFYLRAIRVRRVFGVNTSPSASSPNWSSGWRSR